MNATFEKGARADRYRTCFDADTEAWRVIWMAPAGREFVSLRRQGRLEG